MDEAESQEAALLAEAKRLIRTIRAATLATLTPEGTPFASLTAVATMPDGSMILLLSQLAAHTRQLDADGRCSILLAQAGRGDPLAHPRLTLVGEAARFDPSQRPEARRRFLSRNPKSELYADFPDFAFWHCVPQAAHLNGGFGRAAIYAGDAVLTRTEGCEALIMHEEGAVAHMNADHRDALKLYATRLLRLPDRDWRLSGLDPEGMDLVSGDLTGRLVFPQPVTSGGELRQLLVTLAAEARAAAD
ncbi:HugZ family pyridoxamine 5'-phosphate oxidase [Lichenifustis flavocetrariae]|uniref:DUF2470 domain-containing protein n=1 Tax=Lichenifustis flavocetrariae TaxID=2949735 RepID=A0AA42CIC6_9HYPH|nr:DUF2470 domain-containing protein [Lichenifustis flavocetrariae]MCW6508224.1 DUF2470 domain-containing protein [Lichenifustis flavocetrariae]